ncbi:MAG: N-acetylmuramoyl-L-alanine amidase, partial [Proteobacteria bacterium]|nr:N-acetylmuramoyl-L-alanine amidase [Pseudomonadota bacterium]
PKESYGPEVSDARVRAHWATWAHPKGEEAIYLSIHSDGGRGRGTTALVAESPPKENLRLANVVRTHIIKEARHLVPGWIDRGTKFATFSEVSLERNPEMPAVLLEMGFHDNHLDAVHLRSPAFLDHLAAGVVHGVVAWRHGDNGPTMPLVHPID